MTGNHDWMLLVDSWGRELSFAECEGTWGDGTACASCRRCATSPSRPGPDADVNAVLQSARVAAEKADERSKHARSVEAATFVGALWRAANPDDSIQIDPVSDDGGMEVTFFRGTHYASAKVRTGTMRRGRDIANALDARLDEMASGSDYLVVE